MIFSKCSLIFTILLSLFLPLTLVAATTENLGAVQKLEADIGLTKEEIEKKHSHITCRPYDSHTTFSCNQICEANEGSLNLTYTFQNHHKKCGVWVVRIKSKDPKVLPTETAFKEALGKEDDKATVGDECFTIGGPSWSTNENTVLLGTKRYPEGNNTKAEPLKETVIYWVPHQHGRGGPVASICSTWYK